MTSHRFYFLLSLSSLRTFSLYFSYSLFLFSSLFSQSFYTSLFLSFSSLVMLLYVLHLFLLSPFISSLTTLFSNSHRSVNAVRYGRSVISSFRFILSSFFRALPFSDYSALSSNLAFSRSHSLLSCFVTVARLEAH